MLLGDALVNCVLAATLGASAILGLRYLFYAALYERTRHALRRRGPGLEMYTPVIVEELWEGLGSSILVALASAALYGGHNGSCHLADTSGCLAGWPLHGHPWTIEALFLLNLAWYAQCTSKHWAGLGRVQGADTTLHHAATLALLCLAYCARLLRAGLLAHWLFTATLPLLSASKVMHCMDVRPRAVKKAAFVALTAAYAATRVVAVPAVLLRRTLADAGSLAPLLPPLAAAAANGCLLLLYGISLFWFGRLLAVLATGRLDASPRLLVAGAEARRWQKSL